MAYGESQRHGVEEYIVLCILCKCLHSRRRNTGAPNPSVCVLAQAQHAINLTAYKIVLIPIVASIILLYMLVNPSSIKVGKPTPHLKVQDQ